MLRCFLVGGLLLVVAGCKPKSFSPASNDASSGDDGGACVCELANGTSSVNIPCGGTGCADGTTYVCTAEGTVLPSGGAPCGPLPEAAPMEAGECIPTGCTGTMCNTPDNCGGTCKCLLGVTCNPNGTCGNGCDLGVGEACLVDAGSATTCCSSGYVCFSHDGGVDSCCAGVGGGHCTQDTDCCDYPAAHCSTTTNTCG